MTEPGGVARLVARSRSWRQWSACASAWERVHDACPDASFFTTRAWVEAWLATFGNELDPEIVMFEHGGDVVGCCVLVSRTQWVRGIPVRRVFLNCAGEDEQDSTCIEYNTLLAVPGFAPAVTAALERVLRGRYWDELRLDGVSDDTAVASLTTPLGRSTVRSRRSHYVDLGKLRRDGTTFEAVMSTKARQHARRNERLYEKASGPCTVRVAETCAEALEIFGRLAELHQVAWVDRGETGAFASAKFTQFHRRLIEQQFDRGEIRIVEIRAGTELIGALYNFVHRQRLYFYQSGIRYTDHRLSPGILMQYLAIRDCLAHTDVLEYDFLAGDAKYKRSLASASRGMAWIEIARPTISMLVLRALRRVKRAVEKRRAPAAAVAPTPAADAQE